MPQARWRNIHMLQITQGFESQFMLVYRSYLGQGFKFRFESAKISNSYRCSVLDLDCTKLPPLEEVSKDASAHNESSVRSFRQLLLVVEASIASKLRLRCSFRTDRFRSVFLLVSTDTYRHQPVHTGLVAHRYVWLDWILEP